MDDAIRSQPQTPVDGQRNDFDPELTEVVRRAFGTFEEFENSFSWHREKNPVEAKRK